MKIGELAKATGTAIETIRFYEREELLPVTPRSEGNYRIYGAVHTERLAFIRHCRSLDMALDEIGVLSQNRRNFRHPSSSPATSASRSIILPSLWKV